VRLGRTGLFRHIYQRHHAAVYAYALTCVPSPVYAFELSSQVFADLLQTTLSEQSPTRRRHSDCLRIQLLQAVRNAAVARSRHDQGLLAPGFRSWLETGAAWSLDDDGQLVLAYEHLTGADQCLVWHGVVERDDPESMSRITGLPAETVQDRSGAAVQALRRARTELYRMWVARTDCLTFVTAVGPRPGEKPNPESTEHLADCPACRAFHDDLIRIDSRVTAQLPSRLLGWWPMKEYRRTKETIQVPVMDPPFLARALQNEREPYGKSPSPADRTPPPRTRSHARRPPRTRVSGRKDALTVVALASLTLVAVVGGILAGYGTRGAIAPPLPDPTPGAIGDPAPTASAPPLSMRTRVDADAFDSQRETRSLAPNRPHALVLGSSSELRYEAVDFGRAGDRRVIARLAGPRGGHAWLDLRLDDRDGPLLARIHSTPDGALSDVGVRTAPVFGVHRVVATATCPTADPCLELDWFGTVAF
jgi:hypothetical protein